MRTFSKFTIYLLIPISIILILLPISWFPTSYDVRFMGWSMLLGATIIYFLPSIFISKTTTINTQNLQKIRNLLQFALAISISGDALGNLGLYELYKIGIQYDKILHFFVPLMWVIVLSTILQIRFRINRPKSIVIVFFFMICCGILWEIFEYSSDVFLHTHLSGEYGLHISTDTKFDLIFDFVGSSVGALIIILKPKIFTSPQRR